MVSHEPVLLSVSRVRQEIWRAAVANREAGGQPTVALLGSMFHDAFAAALASAQASSGSVHDWWKVRDHVYQSLIGPRLNAQQGALQEASPEVLSFWKAVSEMCRWTCQAMEAAGQAALVQPERALSWDLCEPGWSRPVRVTGVADAVWRKSKTGEWCVVEYKLGRTSPDADLTQACLYHHMLGGDGPLAVLRFLPEVEETFYPVEALGKTRQPLIDLIGSLAGVVSDSRGVRPEPVPPSPEHAELGANLLKILEEFGSPARIDGDPVVGPTFIRYVVEPEHRIRAQGILRQALDLQVRLRLDAPPIIHVDQGRLVIDLQRKDRQTVHFSSVRDQLPVLDPIRGSTLAPLGIDLAGKLRFADLSSPVNSHLLVAGTSGSGKSEWLRTALTGLTATNTPDTLRLVLIDPKRNAFADLKDSPFLLTKHSLIHPPDQSAVDALYILVDEMEIRYRAFEPHGARDLDEYIRKSGDRKPRIVCVCDEYADLIAPSKTIRRQIEGAISRLGAKARAAGIHLIVATQRPSRDMVAGALKANMSCSVALKTKSAIESRLILEEAGAENLLGHGDLLFRDIGAAIRLQAPLVERG